MMNGLILWNGNTPPPSSILGWWVGTMREVHWLVLLVDYTP